MREWKIDEHSDKEWNICGHDWQNCLLVSDNVRCMSSVSTSVAMVKSGQSGSEMTTMYQDDRYDISKSAP